MNFNNIYFNVKYCHILTSRLFKNRMFIEQSLKHNFIFTEKGKTFFSSLWDSRSYNSINNRYYTQGVQFIIFLSIIILAQFLGVFIYFNDLFEFVYWKSFDSLVFFSLMLRKFIKELDKQSSKLLFPNYNDQTGNVSFCTELPPILTEYKLPEIDTSILEAVKYLQVSKNELYGLSLDNQHTVVELNDCSQQTNKLKVSLLYYLNSTDSFIDYADNKLSSYTNNLLPYSRNLSVTSDKITELELTEKDHMEAYNNFISVTGYINRWLNNYSNNNAMNYSLTEANIKESSSKLSSSLLTNHNVRLITSIFNKDWWSSALFNLQRCNFFFVRKFNNIKSLYITNKDCTSTEKNKEVDKLVNSRTPLTLYSRLIQESEGSISRRYSQPDLSILSKKSNYFKQSCSSNIYIILDNFVNKDNNFVKYSYNRYILTNMNTKKRTASNLSNILINKIAFKNIKIKNDAKNSTL